MTDDQVERIIGALDRLEKLIERVSRPPVIVTKDEDCDIVQNYRRRGYPVYYVPDDPERPRRLEEYADFQNKIRGT
jgi:hypothetical protein